MVAAEPVAQQFGKGDSLNVFISRLLRVNQFIQEGLVYHKANFDHDNALPQMEVYSFLNDWSIELVIKNSKGSCSQGDLSLLVKILEIVDKGSQTDLCLMNRIHREYTEWCKSKSSQEGPETSGSGTTGVLGKSPRKRSPSPNDSQPRTKRQSMDLSKVEESVNNDEEQVPPTDSAESSSRQSPPTCKSKSSQEGHETSSSGSTSVLGKSLRKRSASPDDSQPETKRQSMDLSKVEESVDNDDEQVPPTDSAESSSRQSPPTFKSKSLQQGPETWSSGSTSVLGKSPRKRSPSPDDSQPNTKRQSMDISKVEESVNNDDQQVPATDSAESSSRQSPPTCKSKSLQEGPETSSSGSTSVLGKSPRKRSPSPDDSQPNTKRQSMDISKVEESVDNDDQQVPATDSAESSSRTCGESMLGVSPRFAVEFNFEVNRRVVQLIQGPVGQMIVNKFNLQVTRFDIRTLYGSNWLNDNVINFYMELLNERAQLRVGQLPSVYAMNSYFLTRLMQMGYNAVRRWTRKVDIFSKQIIPVPVHFNGQPSHWSMAIIDMRNKTIRFYDSLGLSNTPALEALAAYLEQESVDKRHQPFDRSCFKIENVKEVPRQSNGNDCGVFCCMFAEYLTRNAPLTFTQAHMVALRKKMMLEIADGKLWT